MAEKLMVVLNKGENLSHGITLLNIPGKQQHVVYEIVENSPAAENGMVEAGDVILKVNGTDVEPLTSRELLKFLRVSKDPVTIELKRDKHINAEFIKAKLENQKEKHHHNTKIPNLNLSNKNVTSEIRQQSSTSSIVSPTKINSKIARPQGISTITTQRATEIIQKQTETTQQRTEILQQRTDNNIQQRTPENTRIRSRIPQVIKSPTPPGQTISSPISPPLQTSHSNERQCKSAEPLKSDKTKFSYLDNHSSGNLVGNNTTSNENETNPPAKARFEAYMMTGDLILNLSRTPQSTGILNTTTQNNKRNDTLRDTLLQSKHRNGSIVAPYAKYDSSPSSPSSSDTSDTGNFINNINQKDNVLNYDNSKIFSSNNKEHINKIGNIINDINGESNYNKLTDQGCANVSSSTNITSNNTYIENTTTSSSHYSEDLVDFITERQLNKQLKSCDSRSSSSSTVRGDVNSSEISFSVPTSPTSASIPLIEGGSGSNLLLKKKESSNSVPTSPEYGAQEFIRRSNQQHNCVARTCDAAGFRTSRSEDHLQATQRDGMGTVIPIDIDEDVNSSLNTLLDTRQDSEDTQDSDRDRIVWTYNAPINQQSYGDNSSHSSSINSSPQRSDSPASPTSVSSSVMSSNSSSKGNSNNGINGMHNLMCPVNGDQSVSEAISNISSPDYQDDDNLLSSRDIAMAISDPSDSDSTILVSEAQHHFGDKDHNRIVIQVSSNQDSSNFPTHQGYSELKDSEDELATLTDDPPTILMGQDGRESSPPISDDGSDVESLHSYHYSPKAVDIPSAVRLAKRLYGLDGFKKSDVSRHLSKNNDFSRAVAEEYLKYFSFEKISLDEALRQFLQQFSLSGETQERERVLVHFSKRFLDCNPNCFNSQDAVHTLTCAIMLLNTDLHGQNIGRRMTCSEFIENLADLNDGENFPKDILKYLYQAIKSNPLQWALDEDYPVPRKSSTENSLQGPPVGPNPFLDTPQSAGAIEYKKGYVMRKCCYDSNNKKTPFGKRSWKMFYCTLRDLVLYLHKDEHGFRKNQMSDNVHNAIRIHHALATKALDYTKKQHVFRLQTSDQAEYLFQTSDSKELQSWIDTINLVCASFSAPPLEGGVGSQKRFQRPLLPSTHTKFLLKEQLENHEQRITELSSELEKHRHLIVPSKGLALQNYKEKDAYLQYELKRYKAYVNVLKPKVEEGDQQSLEFFQRKQNEEMINLTTTVGQRNNSNILSSPSQLNASGLTSAGAIINELDIPNQENIASSNNRYSYRAAIYRSDAQHHDLG